MKISVTISDGWYRIIDYWIQNLMNSCKAHLRPVADPIVVNKDKWGTKNISSALNFQANLWCREALNNFIGGRIYFPYLLDVLCSQSFKRIAKGIRCYYNCKMFGIYSLLKISSGNRLIWSPGRLITSKSWSNKRDNLERISNWMQPGCLSILLYY